MQMKIILFFLYLSSILHAQHILKNEYFINHDTVMLSDIVKIPKKNDIALFTLPKERHSLRVKTRNLTALLRTKGYKDYVCKHRGYIQFTKRSPIPREKLKKAIKNLYQQKYPLIQIRKINVEPNRYLTKLPARKKCLL
jgi:hypothetical protein